MRIDDWKQLIGWISGCVLVGFAATWLLGLTPFGRDDSDPGRWGDRSWITPRIDHATGCQYITAPQGGITPRMTADGQHMGCRR